MKQLMLLASSMFFLITTAFAQQTVSGRVTDDKGNPVEGISVKLKGTTTGTTTDKNGKWLHFWMHTDYHYDDAGKVNTVVQFIDRHPIMEATKGMKM